MRERDLAFFVAHGEIIPAAVFEVSHAGDTNTIAVNDRPWHHRHFWPPGAVMRRFDADKPNHHAEKESRKNGEGRRLTRIPYSPDAEDEESQRQRQAQPMPRQVVVNRQGGPAKKQD